MSDTIIEVENLSKQYRLGEVSTGTISHDINRWWARMRGKEDPTLSITHANVRDQKAEKLKTEKLKKNAGEQRSGKYQDFSISKFQDLSSDYVWALEDINFSVKRGEVLGIIGRNGAGKSTLLKILSRITAPTTGEIRVDGRIASLLEVGTGFHPELTGRENIFLNGAILGMTKAEIRSKLDEIVDFSGCARYLDTPVKRYSSGMVVRLGFAVAAHLEPDILIVDEVLAVGDVEFQKKCIGKMQDVAGQGRTVLFVSHNMGAVRSLCKTGMVLSRGGQVFRGLAAESVEYYQKGFMDALSSSAEFGVLYQSSSSDKLTYVSKVELMDEAGKLISEAVTGETCRFRIHIVSDHCVDHASIEVHLETTAGQTVMNLATNRDGGVCCRLKAGTNVFELIVHDLPIAGGRYVFGAGVAIENTCWLDFFRTAFDVCSNDVYNSGFFPVHPKTTVVPRKIQWVL